MEWKVFKKGEIVLKNMEEVFDVGTDCKEIKIWDNVLCLVFMDKTERVIPLNRVAEVVIHK